MTPDDPSLELIEDRGWWTRKGYPGPDWTLINSVYRHDEYEIAGLQKSRFNECVVDIGACIGAFSRKAYERNPQSKIVSIEAHPWNIPALTANVGRFANVINAACTYEAHPKMLSSIYPGTMATGGSTIVPRGIAENDTNPIYRQDVDIAAAITLEQIIEQNGIDYIDLLKLDCEGSEYSIFGNTTSLHRVGAIVMEYHGGLDRFLDLVWERFPVDDWFCKVKRGADHMGLAFLFNRQPPPWVSKSE